MKALLGKLHSITISKNRGSKISKKAELLFNKFVKQVDKIFKNLPKSLEWQSFYIHDLPLLMGISKEVQKVSIQSQRSEKYSIGRSLLYVIRYLTRYHLAFDNSIPARSPRRRLYEPEASPEPARHSPEAKPMADGRERWRAGMVKWDFPHRYMKTNNH